MFTMERYFPSQMTHRSRLEHSIPVFKSILDHYTNSYYRVFRIIMYLSSTSLVLKEMIINLPNFRTFQILNV